MVTAYTSRAKVRKPAVGDSSWAAPLNENADLIEGIAAVGGLCVTLKEIPSVSLNVAVAAGAYLKEDSTFASYAGNSSFALAASSTLNIWLTDAGVLTSGAAWPGTAHIRLATVVTGGSSITSVTDARITSTSGGAAPAIAPVNATYIVQTSNATLTNEQVLASLSTGVLKVTTTTGVLSTAVAGTDYLAPAAIGVTVQAFDADLTAVAGLSSNGMICRTGAGTASVRTITGTSNQVVVSNGDGVSGNPTLSTPQSIHTAATPTFGGLTISTSGIAVNGGHVTFADAQNLIIGTTTGTKIGTGTSAKIGFWNATPVIQQAHADQLALGDLTGGTPTSSLNDVGASFNQATLNNNFATIIRLLNRLRLDLVTPGFIKGSA